MPGSLQFPSRWEESRAHGNTGQEALASPVLPGGPISEASAEDPEKGFH